MYSPCAIPVSAVGAEVMQSLLPAQQIVKIVNEELTALMGGEGERIRLASHPPTVVMMVGLQGAGKTTHCGKLAGMFRKQGRRPLLVGVSAAMLLLLVAERRQICETGLSRVAGGLLAGGILGNLVDRLRTGLVVDFVHCHWGDAWHFPTFNLADSAICVGVGLLLLASLPCFRTRPSSSSPRSQPFCSISLMYSGSASG